MEFGILPVKESKLKERETTEPPESQVIPVQKHLLLRLVTSHLQPIKPLLPTFVDEIISHNTESSTDKVGAKVGKKVGDDVGNIDGIYVGERVGD